MDNHTTEQNMETTSSGQVILEGNISQKQLTFAERTKGLTTVSTKNSQNENKKPIVVEFILPFNKETFMKTEEQEKLFSETLSAIRKELPVQQRNNITVIKTTITKKDGKKLKAVRLLASPDMEGSIQRLKMKGINVRDRHISAWGPKVFNPNAFPREVNLSFRTLAHCFADNEVFEALNLPVTRRTTNIIKHKIETEDGGFVFTGNANCKLLMETEEERKLLAEWAKQHCTEQFQLHEIPFYCNIPSLLTCSFCEGKGKLSAGHDESYCYEKARVKQKEVQDIPDKLQIEEIESTEETNTQSVSECESVEMKTTNTDQVGEPPKKKKTFGEVLIEKCGSSAEVSESAGHGPDFPVSCDAEESDTFESLGKVNIRKRKPLKNRQETQDELGNDSSN